MKNKYPFQVIDLRHQVDHITQRKYKFLKNLIPILQMLMRNYSL